MTDNMIDLPEAMEFREAGEYKKAQQWLYNFLADKPNHAEAWSLLSHVLILDKKIAEAANALAKAFQINSELSSAFRNQARILLGKSQHAEALTNAQAALNRSPDDPENFLVLAACLATSNLNSEALFFIEKALLARPNYSEALALRASLRARTKDLVGAIEDASKAASIKPHNAQIWALLGSLYFQNNDLSGAIVGLEKAHFIESTNIIYIFNLGEFYRRGGQIEKAISVLEKGVQLEFKNANAWTNFAVCLMEKGEINRAKLAFIKVLELDQNSILALNNLGTITKNSGDILSSLAYFEKLNSLNPNFPHVHFDVAELLASLGRLDEAEASFRKVISLNPNSVNAYISLGDVLSKLARFEAAETSYKSAIALNPGSASAHNNLGILLKDIDRLDEAEECYRKAIAMDPNLVEAHNNLGAVLQDLDRATEAVDCYRKAISVQPNFASAHNNLGLALKDLNQILESIESYKKAIQLQPDYSHAHTNLASALASLGRDKEAFKFVITSLKLKPTSPAKNLFVSLTAKVTPNIWDASVSDMVTTALLEPWGRPGDAISFACRMLKRDINFEKMLNEVISTEIQYEIPIHLTNTFSEKLHNCQSLLFAILLSAPIPDRELENFFTKLRILFLKQSISDIPYDFDNDFLCSLLCHLAQQCFINEYVYYQTDEEEILVKGLIAKAEKAIKLKEQIPGSLITVIACYFPLYSLSGAENLLRRTWKAEVASVLKQQIEEPLEELRLRHLIPSLTSADNKVSLEVQKQYEENPYPRWVSLGKIENALYLNKYFRKYFFINSFKELADDKSPKILVAGCGTGLHPIGSAQLIKGASVLAIDLSMTSLSYAKRKTIELGLSNIDYAQADLLKLESLGQTFDVIESSGVLHHLEHPFKGWQALLRLLKPNGLMKLGFYSGIARRDIVNVRDLIAKEGIGDSARQIRAYRKHLLELEEFSSFGFAIASSDFFSLSACRDLLFHVQEHRMTLPILKDFMNSNDLNFLGFDIDLSVKNSYKNRFPMDPSTTDLNNWHLFEEDNPYTFVGMYQFWIQKNT
jgi:tetratricopeptide (TPR) repeat protein/2-polyprenyl-3-methyl-5-hydroxy-6-metoxy-1,4-benzoquinol methylase